MHPLLLSAQKQLILEDIFADVLKLFPNQQHNLEQAKAKGVKPKYFKWLAKTLASSDEPVEDVIPLLIAFEKKSQALSQKFGQGASDINRYESVAALSDKLESLQKQPNQVSGLAENNVVYEDDELLVVMPQTTQESCELGSGTSWCTARTQSQNLFLSYVAREDSEVILFYIIRKNGNPRKNPTDKVSVGFRNGTPVFSTQHGGITVDAANNGLSKEAFDNLFGQKSATLLAAMSKTSSQLKGQHPAKKELGTLIGNPDLFAKKLASFKGDNEKEDFIHNVLMHSVIPTETVSVIFNSTKSTTNKREYVAQLLEHPRPWDTLQWLMKYQEEHPGVFSSEIYIDFINQAASDDEMLAKSIYYLPSVQSSLEQLLNHPHLGDKATKQLYDKVVDSEDESQIFQVVQSPKLSEVFLQDAIRRMNYLPQSNLKLRYLAAILFNPNLTKTQAETLYQQYGQTEGHLFVAGQGVPDEIKLELVDKNVFNVALTYDDPKDVTLSNIVLQRYAESGNVSPYVRNWATDVLLFRQANNLKEIYFCKF